VNGVVVSGGCTKAACVCFGLTKNRGGGTRRLEIEPKEKKDRGWRWRYGPMVTLVDGGSRHLAGDTGCCGGKLRDGEGEAGHARVEEAEGEHGTQAEKRGI